MPEPMPQDRICNSSHPTVSSFLSPSFPFLVHIPTYFLSYSFLLSLFCFDNHPYPFLSARSQHKLPRNRHNDHRACRRPLASFFSNFNPPTPLLEWPATIMGSCMSVPAGLGLEVSEQDKTMHREAEKQLKEVRFNRSISLCTLMPPSAGKGQDGIAGQGSYTLIGDKWLHASES